MTSATPTPPGFSTLRIELDGDIGTLTLNRPDAMNAFDPELISELSTAAAWLADEAAIRALIVTGAGRAFSAGGDVGWFQQGLSEDGKAFSAEVREKIGRLHQAILIFRRLPYAVIAAINGPAAGAGLSLALMCDVRIASDRASLVVAYGRIGASPDGGMTYFLPRLVGSGRAMEIMLTDPTLSAEDALRLGLVSEVIAHDDLGQASREMAGRLAAKAPHYVRTTKSLFARSLTNQLDEHLELERHGIADSIATDDFRTGLDAFAAGTKPDFQGS